MRFHFHHSVQGGHTHVKVFAGSGPGALGLCGNLTFRNEEWLELRARLLAFTGPAVIQMIDRDDGEVQDA